MHSPDFFKKMQRTRKEILKEISDKYDSANKRRLNKMRSNSNVVLPGISGMKRSPSESDTLSTTASVSDSTSNLLKPELSKIHSSSSESLSDHLLVPTIGK
jgi:hypothetical protein